MQAVSFQLCSASMQRYVVTGCISALLLQSSVQPYIWARTNICCILLKAIHPVRVCLTAWAVVASKADGHATHLAATREERALALLKDCGQNLAKGQWEIESVLRPL